VQQARLGESECGVWDFPFSLLSQKIRPIQAQAITRHAAHKRNVCPNYGKSTLFLAVEKHIPTL